MSSPYRNHADEPDDAWTTWLGPRWRARVQLDDAVSTVDRHSLGDTAAVHALRDLAIEQGKEIARLEAVVLSLVRALSRSGALDLDMLQSHVEAKIVAADAVLGVVRDPLDTLNFDPNRLVKCVRCRQTVVAKTTFISKVGTVCERCFEKLDDG